MNEFIDERNRELWEALNENYNIKIEASLNGEYGCYTISNSAIIYVDYNNISKNFFTHELLHIYLKQKEFYLGSSIIITLQQSNILNRILSESLLEHIGNCLDHLKMFEFYKKLGFEEKEFILDFDDHKCNAFELSNLKNNFKTRKAINPNAIDFYVGKLIAMLCDPNTKNDYSQQLIEFKKLNIELFNIVEKLVVDTKEFDIESKNILNSYRDISLNFYSRITKWVHKNKIK